MRSRKTSASVGVVVVVVLAFLTGWRVATDPAWLTAVSAAIVAALTAYVVREISRN